MKSVKLSHNNYFDIERVIRKIAEENDIKNISKINIKLSKEVGYVKFAIIDDWAEYPEDTADWEGADDDKTNKDETKSSGPRYTIYYKDGIKMNGEGIDYIIDNEDGEKYSPDQGLEGIIEDLSETHPEFHDYEFGIYVGADFSGPSLNADYEVDTPDYAVDIINRWLWENTTFEKIGEEE